MAKSFYGIIGWPLTTTFSPAFFNSKFAEEHIHAAYNAYPLERIEELPALLQKNPELAGLNVTIPYKTAVLPYLHAISEDAAALGAVNCIAIKNGKLTGHNTDWIGFTKSLQPLLKSQHQQALILGNGGAAKAVAYALRQLHIPYRVVARGHDSNTIHYKNLTTQILQQHKLIINTTPLGMPPDEDRAPEIDYASLTPEHLLYDLIYQPAETVFLKLGAAQGAAVKNGYEMLLLQAQASWDIWHPPTAQ